MSRIRSKTLTTTEDVERRVHEEHADMLLSSKDLMIDEVCMNKYFDLRKTLDKNTTNYRSDQECLWPIHAC
jgi:hypothetical protein